MAASDKPAIDLKDRGVYASWTRITLRFSDLDPNGHANNGAINAYFEDGRVGFRYEFMGDSGIDLIQGYAVVGFNAAYLDHVRYPGEVEVGTVVTRIGNASFGLGQGVFQGDLCAATAEVAQVYFDPSTGRSRPLPDPLRAALTAGMKAG
ncbi:MAG: thioesterase family protein [Alphaproteobacteria bacterium]